MSTEKILVQKYVSVVVAYVAAMILIISVSIIEGGWTAVMVVLAAGLFTYAAMYHAVVMVGLTLAKGVTPMDELTNLIEKVMGDTGDREVAELVAHEWWAYFDLTGLPESQRLEGFKGEIRHRSARGIDNIRAPKGKAE